MSTNRYESPLSSRYASDEMQYIFSPDKKFSTWRRLWVALARAEMELGLPVTQEQVDEAVNYIFSINKCYYGNTDVRNIVNEEIASFFSGQKSAQEVAKVIQSRAQIYVNEKR